MSVNTKHTVNTRQLLTIHDILVNRFGSTNSIPSSPATIGI